MTSKRKLVLWVSILAALVPYVDASIVNVALPAIARELGGGLSTQQWVSDAYLITLGSLILLAGSLSDILGRRRILLVGLLSFIIASVFCALAPSSTALIIGRAVQGLAGALLVPSSLALIIESFSGKEQGRAIGLWTSWTGIAFLLGPLLGGYLVDASSWRVAFAINLLPGVLTLWLITRLDASESPGHRRPVDVLGAVLCALGLAGIVYGLIEQPHLGWGASSILASLIGGAGLLIWFALHERRTEYPMLPLSLFAVRNFWAGNLATLAVYAALAVAVFSVTVFVQQVGGYSAFLAGLSMLPTTIIMMLLSSRFGALAGRYGPRIFMAVGPCVSAVGFLLMLRVSEPVHYWSQLFPGIVVFGIGLSLTVAPLTAAVLGGVDSENAGIGSAVNNAVARIAGLLSVAGLGVVAGTQLDVEGFRRSIVLTVGLLVLGGIVSALSIVNRDSRPTA